MKTICITSYFNPENFQTKKQNYKIFKSNLIKKNIPLYTFETAKSGSEFQLEVSEFNLRYLSSSVLWQKERLLNIGLMKIPREVKNIIWLDSDILFENENWFYETEKLLEEYKIVQPYSDVYRMKQGVTEKEKTEEHWFSFAKQFLKNPFLCTKGDFIKHGHTGFAWAIKKEILDKFGFFDTCVAGSGDHVMAHAFVGDWDSPCVTRVLGEKNVNRENFLKWAKKIYSHTKSSISFTNGNIYHLWHGETTNRKYVKRNWELAKMGFNPKKHLTIEPSGLYKWSRDAKEFEIWAKKYFEERLEDGIL